ncbi:MAG: class C sortase [Eubacteriales bacterium]|jgi:sortase A
MKKQLQTLSILLIFLIGLSLLLYPTFSDYWNTLNQTKAIISYSEAVNDIDTTVYDEMMAKARSYNEALAISGVNWEMTEEEEEDYNQTLNVTDTGIMAYIEISKIACTLPIHHGISEPVLQKAVGHLLGSSLPIGGESTHSVLSAHRGLPSAKLFTDLDKMVVGDQFLIRTMNEVLTYEVDQILIVEPTDLSSLLIESGEDFCTLVTCTPYGINTHRLLVRGHRVETVIEDTKSIRVVADAIQISSYVLAAVLAIAMLILIMIGVVIIDAVKKIKHRKTTSSQR